MRLAAPGPFDVIADEAAAESELWAEALLDADARQLVPVFSQLCEPVYALAVETIYEGYLAHYGRPRLFAPSDEDSALLLGDYLYAHGLVRVAETGNVIAVGDLAELISLCAQLRADGRTGDGAAWAATAAQLGTGTLAGARSALRDARDDAPLLRAASEQAGGNLVDRALAAHAARLG
jgi:hypothetical protein